MSAEPIEFDVFYGPVEKPTHHYRETWERLDIFCPKCGKKEVFHELSGGDYYIGALHLCRACASMFYLPGGVSDGAYAQNVQRLNHLRSCV